VADAREELVPAPSFDASISFAAGALRSTARDLILWDRALALEIVPDGGLSGGQLGDRFTLRQAGFSGVYERETSKP
jgi:hypothetical protein